MIEIQASIISHSSILRKLNSGLRALPWESGGQVLRDPHEYHLILAVIVRT
jgi:hypothetical protein